MRAFTVDHQVNLGIQIEGFEHGVRGVKIGPGRQFVRLANDQFDERMIRFSGASFIRSAEKRIPLLVTPTGNDSDQVLVLFDPGPGRWTPQKRNDAPCPQRGNQLVGFRCKLCRTENPAKQTQPFKDPTGIHPDKGFVSGALWNDWAPLPNEAEVLSEFKSAHRATRLLALKKGAVIRIIPPNEGQAKFLFWDGKELKYGTETEVFGPVPQLALAATH